MAKKDIGLYEKFTVTRSDGRDREGQKHYGCRYFVLDYDHDEFAHIAIAAYAAACKDKYPELSKDLFRIAKGERIGLLEIDHNNDLVSSD